ncbi:hypothetical protein V6O07_04520, partial [Arthrospira platensis SPKY2]
NGALFSDEIVNSNGVHIELYARNDVSFDEIAIFERDIKKQRDVVSLSVTIIPDAWFNEVKWPEPRSNERLIFEGALRDLVSRAKELEPKASAIFQLQQSIIRPISKCPRHIGRRLNLIIP